MAGIAKRKNGSYFLRFIDGDGERRTLALGTRSERKAVGIKLRVEDILAARFTGQPIDPATLAWLANASPTMRCRLAKVGLIDAPAAPAADRPLTLGEFLARYIENRRDVKESTRTNWRHSERNLLAFFGADRPLASITAGDAKDFERYIKLQARKVRKSDEGDSGAARGLNGETVRKRISNAKQFFADAVARELVARNPFAELKSSVRANRGRDHFISRDDAQKIIDACPDAQWRLLFALSRFGGLRCPSEHLSMKLGDVDWERGRLTIHSPKTEHHEGKESRVVPLFPELRPHLEAVWDQAEPGTEFVITRYRSANANLRTQLLRIIQKAGVKPWPKLFQNLRSSRATELAAEHPAHVAAEWLGHSTLVARKHYWQVTEADFEQASGALHLRSSEASQGMARQRSDGAKHADNCDVSQPVAFRVGDTGLEPVTPSLSSWCSSQLS
jgi:integrase